MMRRMVGKIVMVVALGVMTAGVMPAPGGGCGGCRTVPNLHTYSEQSAKGGLFDQIAAWVQSLGLSW